jgi:23S rRNA (cytidine1920-2'-O)/16S rRNA (cytidine1409-2'-O)-methyltransferase
MRPAGQEREAMTHEPPQYVSRGGAKLAAALDAFALDPSGWRCADFGCNVGGFTDCLLQRGAQQVYAVDTGYGALAWTLRNDDRVAVMERTNALHAECPEPVDLVTIDVSVTPQSLVVPVAAGWLKPTGRIVSLLKPSFEYQKLHGRKAYHGLDDAQAEAIAETVCGELAEAGFLVAGRIESPLRGKGGNIEFLLHVQSGQ